MARFTNTAIVLILLAAPLFILHTPSKGWAQTPLTMVEFDSFHFKKLRIEDPGASFEARFLTQLIRNKDAVKGGRFYASKGFTDVWWVDLKGIHNEAQLKFSSKKNPYISPHELEDLKLFARKMKGYMKIWLVKKQTRKPIDMELLN